MRKYDLSIYIEWFWYSSDSELKNIVGEAVSKYVLHGTSKYSAEYLKTHVTRGTKQSTCSDFAILTASLEINSLDFTCWSHKLYYQPKQCTFFEGNSLKNYHTFGYCLIPPKLVPFNDPWIPLKITWPKASPESCILVTHRISSWWLNQPLWKILVRLGIFPK